MTPRKKAIDYACRLLARLNQDDMDPEIRQVLLAVAAGKKTYEEVSDLTGLQAEECKRAAILLAADRYIYLTKESNEKWVHNLSLTWKGKTFVQQLFSFQRKEGA